MTSQKCCRPAVNGLKRMRTVAEEEAIRYEGTEEPLQRVLIHSVQAEVPNLLIMPVDDSD